MPFYSIHKKDFQYFISKLSKTYHAFYLRGEDSGFAWKNDSRRRLFWQEYGGALEGLVSGAVRAQDPLKQFFFASKEKVSHNFRGLEDKQERPLLLIGAKNCDLTGLMITDSVFMEGDFKDPFYSKRRNGAFIIGFDCSEPIETCFCRALGINPFPEKNFDMSIADIGDVFLVEAVSEKAKNYVSEYKNYFKEATEEQLKKRQDRRSEASQAVDANVKKNQVPVKDQLAGIMDKGFDSKVWEEEIQTCVECGCCNVVCPTCHCFFLSDAKKANDNIRYKVWDACLYKDFAVVAGGANPRKHLAQRLRNRYDKKFAYFPEVLGMIACTGCGRCIVGCPAKIDIRRILKNLIIEALA